MKETDSKGGAADMDYKHTLMATFKAQYRKKHVTLAIFKYSYI